MEKINFHIHSTISDGKLKPEEVITEAINNGLTHICFTDHYKTPNNLGRSSKDYYNDPDFSLLKELKDKSKESLDISIGVEMDWISDYDSWYKTKLTKRKYDFVIGSVHGLMKEGKFISFWDDITNIIQLIKFLGGKKSYVKEYYKQVRLMIESGLFDCLGHLDVIKMNNKDNLLFSESDSWYIEEIKKTLDLLKEKKMCLEINTRGALKMGEGKQYPSLWIIKEARERNIPITIGTDLHNLGQQEPYLTMAHNLARQAGYKELLIFKKRKPIKLAI